MNPRSTQSIQNIPEDVARLIAFYALPSRPTPSRSQSPLSLSQVSSAWRNVVLAASELWSTLFIFVKPVNSDTLDIFQRQAIEWLMRAEGRPLSIFFRFGVDANLRFEPDRDELLGIHNFLIGLYPFIPQARRLGFGYAHINQLLGLLSKVPWSVVNLEALDIVSAFGDEEVIPFHRFTAAPIFNHVPKLRQLVVKGQCMLDSVESALALPWSRLTKVAFADSCLPIMTWVNIIRFCPQMEFGELNILCVDDEDLEQYRSANQRHTQLKTLNLKMTIKLVEFISLFQFTSLRNLYLKSDLCEAGVFPPASYFQNFHGLRSLYIDFSKDIDITLLIHILREGRNIEELTLIHMDKKKNLLFEAMSYDKSPRILPHLGFLRIEVVPEADSELQELQPHWRSLYNMLISRTIGTMPSGYDQLQKLSLSEHSTTKVRHPGVYFPVVHTLTQMLSPCREAGVEILLGECSELDWIPMHISAFEM